MDIPTTTAILTLTDRGAMLDVGPTHHYPITWDDEHPDPRPAAALALARHEGALLVGPWTAQPQGERPGPVGWTAPIRSTRLDAP